MVKFITKNPQFYAYEDWGQFGIEISDDLEGAIAALGETIDFDLETTGFKPWKAHVLLIVLDNFVIDATVNNGWHLSEVMSMIDIPSKVLRGANLKFDLLYHMYYGGEDPRMIWDTMIAEQTLTKGFDLSASLDATVQRRLNVAPLAKQVRAEFPTMNHKIAFFYARHINYAAEDTQHLWRVEEVQRKLAARADLMLNINCNMVTTIAMAKAEARGVLIDQNKWRENALDQQRLLAEAEKELDSMLNTAGFIQKERRKEISTQLSFIDAGYTTTNKNAANINYNSSTQMAAAFDVAGWPVPMDTKEWKVSFAKDVLTNYKIEHAGTPQAAFIAKLKEYKDAMKASTTYGLNFLALVNQETGAIHAEFNVNRTSTGRMSSEKPNMQQIPGKESFRSCFVARPGFKILTADYSSAELRILADFSGDTKMMEILENDLDLHGYVATIVFRELLDEPDLIVDPSTNVHLRKKIKAVIFSKVYGAGVSKTAELLDCSMQQAEVAEKLMRQALPEAFDFLDRVSEEAVRNGYSVFNDVFNSRRYYPQCWEGRQVIDLYATDEYAAGAVERAAKNAPIQGSNADMVKYAVSKIHYFLKKNLLDQDIFLLLQVHDELVFEIRDGLEHWGQHIVDIMNESANRFLKRSKMKTSFHITNCWTK